MTRNGTEVGIRFEYNPPILRYGPNCVSALSAELARDNLDTALVVCGRTIGSTAEVIDPVTAGLDDRLGDVCAETTPAKRLDTAYLVRDRFEEIDADVLVSLGGGSSLDIAKTASALIADDRSREAVEAEFAARGTFTIPTVELPPIVAIPTTLAGADISQGAGITASPRRSDVQSEIGGGISHPSLMPHAVFLDPTLVATTPRSILAASAMNGFNKGIETLYSSQRTVITDATAVHGLRTFAAGLLAFGNGDESEQTYQQLVEGLLCVQYGISRPGVRTLSVIHSFGHALSRTSDLQQGTAHAVVTPHVLADLLEQTAEGSDKLARAFDVTGEENHSEAILERVTSVRDALGLPSRLRDVDGPSRDSFPDVAQSILDDPFMKNAPERYSPSASAIESILENAW